MGDSLKCQDVLAKSVLEFCALVVLMIPLGVIYLFSSNFQPVHRGFYCDDQSLKHPYEPQTVPISLCIAIWAVISIIIIVSVEGLRFWAEKGSRPDKPIANSKAPWIAFELYRQFGYFLLGGLSCLLFTEMAKYTTGRLRPHFLTLCKPNFSNSSICKDEHDYMRFVIEDEAEICLGLQENGGTSSPKELKEARLSFLSGHASFSFFCATFIIVYLQARLANFPPNIKSAGVRISYRSLKIVRPFLQFGLITLAFWISLTRISDYFHHPLDVATGALVGTLWAGITLNVIADIFNKKSVFWKTFNAK